MRRDDDSGCGIGCGILFVVCAFVGACWFVAWGLKMLKAVLLLIAGL